MGKWTCRCGQAMNDHKAPDPNAYSVYSDELLVEIMNKKDGNDTVSYEDISEASFYMWKCPNCGSFMVFGEEDNKDCFTFYERQTSAKAEPLFDPDQELNIVVVEFQEGGNGYTYICDDPTIHVGHGVIVPTGKENTEKTALVVQKYHALPKDITFPVEKLNGVPIPMKVSQIQARDKKYQVDGAFYIKPAKVNYRKFFTLELCADFDIDASRWIDVLSDENVWGNTWELNGLQFGITAGESPEFEDYYGFSLAWKKYESDSDLSIAFYTT